MKKACVIFLGCLITIIASGISPVSAASDFPTRPIEIVSPNAPGGGMDFIFTLFKPKVENTLKQPLVLTYKPGAAGLIGTMYVKGLKPDGYSLLAASISTFILPPLTRKTADYTLDDFTPICNLTTTPLAVCVKEDSPYKTIRDLIETAKTKPLQYSTHGAFTTAHIAIHALAKVANLQVKHIPYPGAAAAMTAALGGHVDFACAATTAFAGPGKLRLLAVISDKRLENYPDVPTLKELGYPIYGQVYYSLWGPRGIPEEIVTIINQGYVKAFQQNKEEITRIAGKQDHDMVMSSSSELKKTFQDQYDFYKKFLADFKLQAGEKGK
jgi:tripartite-type tricarboxylate transporter receptor subunit TctC